MQTIERARFVVDSAPNSATRYSVRQRLLSGSLTLAMGGSASVSTALANAPGAGWSGNHASPITHHAGSLTTNGFHQSFANQTAATGVTNTAGLNLTGHAAAAVVNPLHSMVHNSTLLHNWQHAAHSAPNFAHQATTAQDVNLASAQALFAAGGLAGFHTITLDIGGKQQQINFDTKLTGAELVAAQQVLSGGHQSITINGRGVATGGTFDLSNATMTALDGAISGSIGSLYISRGVQAVDTMSSLNLTGSLINMGSIVVGADPSAKGQYIDAINASNIYNGYGASIMSAAVASALTPTGITLSATNLFVNSGNISSSSVLNISANSISNLYAGPGAPTAHNMATLHAAQNVNLQAGTITNTGLISSTNGNVNISGGAGGGDINFFGAGGAVQASNGNINFNQADYAGISNINVAGGDWSSKQFNLNAHEGAVEVNVGELTGEVNGSACSAHVTAATDTLRLGGMEITGDPTYFNTAGDIVIDSSFKAVSGVDLAIVASGNIIGNGGTLDTSSNSKAGGAITLIAGANITKTTGTSGQAGATAELSNNKLSIGNGSLTGGYIDLEGNFVDKTSKNTQITAFKTSSTVGNGGNILMVAYAGTAKNSGVIVSMEDDATTTNLIDATGSKGTSNGGTVTAIAGGSNIFLCSINSGDLVVKGGVPTITGEPLTIVDGTITKGSVDVVGPSSPTNTAIGLNSNYNVKSVNIDTFGEVDAFGNFTTAGAGGASGVTGVNGGKGGDGAAGGNVSITGNGVFVGYIDASGGGGGGGAAGADGGKGGAGGDISLIAKNDNIQLLFSINASGGGGGGGGGAGTSAVVGNGGAGGQGGNIIIDTPFSYVTPIADPQFGVPFVVAFKGGDGGAGGAHNAGVVGGGGGGGGGSWGGGGGGGAAGKEVTSAAGGGGGGGTGAGGGGGGTDGIVDAVGGGGGSSAGLLNGYTGGAGGNIGGKAGAGGFNSSGAGGDGGNGIAASGGGGAGGGYRDGGIGAPADSKISGVPGNNGTNSTLIGGTNNAVINIGDVTGSAKQPVQIAAPTITIDGGLSKTASVFLSTIGDSVNLGKSKMAAGTTLSVDSLEGALKVTGAITGASVVTLIADSSLDIGANVTAATTVNLHTFTGDITNSAGLAGTITAGTVNLRADGITGGTGNVTATTSANNLQITTASSTLVSITELASSAKATNILASSVSTKGTFSVNSAQQLNVTGVISADQGIVNLTESGNSPIGINITAAPVVGNSGTLNLKTTGTGSINSSKVLIANNINVVAGGAVGSASKPLLTNAFGSIDVTQNSAESVFIKDSNTGKLSVTGTGKSIAGFTLVSASQNLTIPNLQFANVNIQDTYNVAKQTSTLTLALGVGQNIGNGTGTVSITSALASIDETGVGGSVTGTKVTLSSAGGDIGKTGALTVTAPILTANAAKGKVNILDTTTTGVTLNAGTALSSYSVSAKGNLTVSGALKGTDISLTTTAASGGVVIVGAAVGTSTSKTVAINADAGIAQSSGKALISGIDLTLNTGSADIGSVAQAIMTKATGTLTFDGGATSQIYINQSGNITLGGPSTASSLFFTDTGVVTVANSLTYNNVNFTAPSIVVNGSIVTANNATFRSGAGLSITGTGVITPTGQLTLGGNVGGKTTSAITLGDAKTGNGNPLDAALKSGATGVNQLTVTTTGNFTSNLTKIATSTSGSGGAISILAGNIVSLGNTGLITLSADAKTGSAFAGGLVSLNLTGTQAVVLDGVAGSTKAPNYKLTTIGGSLATTDGDILAIAKGNLTVNSLGIDLGPAQTGGSLTFSSAKNLVVSNILNTALNLANVTLSSGSTSAFVINSATANGTAGKISAVNVNISAGGPITVNGAGDIAYTGFGKFSNNLGALTIIGPGSITTGTDLNLTAKSGINLGDAKNQGVNNPLANIGGGNLDNLNVFTGGNFNSGIGTFALKTHASGGNLSITAGNVVNLKAPLSPILFQADGTNFGGTVALNITGTQAVTLGSATVTKGQPNYDISATGSAGGGIVSVTSSGILIADGTANPFTNGNNSLTLSGAKGLSVNNTNLLNGGLSAVNLFSGAATPFVVGAAALSKDLNNGSLGQIDAGAVTITAIKGLTVAAGSSIKAQLPGNSLVIDTSSLLNNGIISGGAGGSTFTMSDPGKNALGVNPAGIGTYTNFNGVVITGSTGNVNVGNLFENISALNNVLISTAGSVTFQPTLPGVTVASGGAISITAGSLVTKATTPIVLTAPGATGQVTLTDKAALVLGTGKGQVSIVNGGGATVVSSGTLTIASDFTPGQYNLTGASVVVNAKLSDPATNIGVINETSKTGSITIGAKTPGAIFANTLNLGFVNPTLSKTPLTVTSGQLTVGGGIYNGAYNVVNIDNSGAKLSALGPVSAITYSATNAPTLNVNSITTTSGGINVTTFGSLNTSIGSTLTTGNGGITLVAGAGNGGTTTLDVGMTSVLSTNNGSITLQDLSITGANINIGIASNIHASATAKGVGQVNIVNGAVPVVGPTLGAIPAPAPAVFTTGGATVTYGSVGAPTGTITTTGSNTFNAFGRNVVFSQGSGTITVNSSTITADPPVDGAAPLTSAAMAGASALPVAAAYSTPVSFAATHSAAGPLTLSQAFDSSTSGLASLAAVTASSNASVVPALTANLANAANSGNLVSSSAAPSTDAITAGRLTLTGEVSNLFVKQLTNGPALIAPDKDEMIKTSFGSVKVAAKAVALIVAFDGGMAVYNLHDNKRDAVVIEHNGQTLSLMPGQNAVVTDRNVRFFEEVNPAAFVGYRRVTGRTNESGVKTFRGEFNIFSLIHGCEPLKQLIKSQEPGKQKLANSVLKTAAILLTTGAATPYQLMNVPAVTAMNRH